MFEHASVRVLRGAVSGDAEGRRSATLRSARATVQLSRTCRMSPSRTTTACTSRSSAGRKGAWRRWRAACAPRGCSSCCPFSGFHCRRSPPRRLRCGSLRAFGSRSRGGPNGDHLRVVSGRPARDQRAVRASSLRDCAPASSCSRSTPTACLCRWAVAARGVRRRCARGQPHLAVPRSCRGAWAWKRCVAPRLRCVRRGRGHRPRAGRLAPSELTQQRHGEHDQRDTHQRTVPIESACR
jgi:hypothetical protein